jgi:formate dehydrogenase major subunit
VENALHPKVSASPVVKRFSSDKDPWGKSSDYPIVCTTYRLTEHFHYWTKHQVGGRLNEVQPGIFFEIPEELAKEKGINNGDMVKISSARASITGPAMVTRRLPHFDLDGKRVWQVGVPIHWGFSGDANHAGPLANSLTSWAIDPNTWTPEYKAFQVKLEKADSGEKSKGDQGEPAKKSEGRA